MARGSRDGFWLRRQLARPKSRRHSEEVTTSVSNESEGGRTTRRWSLFRRLSRNHLTSRSSQSIQNQTKWKASSGLRRLRRSSTSEKASNDLNQSSNQASLTHGLRNASELTASNSTTSLNPQMVQQINAPPARSALLPRTTTIAFEDQEQSDTAVQRFTSQPYHSSSQVNLTSTDKIGPISSLSPPSSLCGDRSSSHITSFKSLRTASQCTTCRRYDHAKTLSREEHTNLHPKPHGKNKMLLRAGENLEELEDFDDTDDEGSRPTKVIRLVAEVLDDSGVASKDAFSDLLSMNSHQEEPTYSSDIYLIAVGNWAEEFDLPYLKEDDYRRLSTHIDEIENSSIGNESLDALKTSFLSLDSVSTYAIQVGQYVGRVGQLVSAWLLFCIAVLRIDKLRLSLFVHTAMLGIGIDLSNRFDLDPDRLVEKAWFIDAASLTLKGSNGSGGKPNKFQSKVSPNVFRDLHMLNKVEGADTVTTPKGGNIRLDLKVQNNAEVSEKSNTQEVQTLATEASATPIDEVIQSLDQDILMPELRYQDEILQTTATIGSSPAGPVFTEPTLPVTDVEDVSNHNKLKSESSREASMHTGPGLLETSRKSKQDEEFYSISPAEEVELMFWTSHSINNRQAAGDFFIRGRVFSIMWHEPIRSANSPPPKRPNGKANRITQAPNGDWIYSHVRRFIVVEAREIFSIAVPISSYGGKGLNKKKFTEAERKGHAIVHPENKQPQLIQGEEPFTKQAIAVKPSPDADAGLDAASRINFRKPTTIEWQNRVSNIGLVSTGSLAYLTTYFNDESKTTGAEV